ncbi:DUF1178 family protein [Pusillimonas sp. MFBS29]|uniref:DUF1178 family protein n=1 Tax=Pusillimonas sp. MFBS29 TaxID=2886690 RepID=UPI001D10BEEA|nr:DUF1178 family protein [Pusillimonas sp. MFBS29]MCC2596495.1 DUF1178 family protein [Pusillimonas sp. MFBS29]
MSLKVFDLQCDQSHVFEGWFSSTDSYESQQVSGLLSCPVCNSHQISKKLSAPRLNVSHIKESAGASAGASDAVAAPSAGQVAQLQAQMLQHIRQMIRNTEDVGVRFAQEVRSMHDGETQERAIRGVATQQEREELARDGIDVMPIPDFLDDERLQ